MKKLISRGSGASLNLFRYAAMVAMLLTLGVGNAWGNNSHSTHYARAKLINQTGHGTVYLSDNASSQSGQTGSSNPGTANGYSYIDWNCGGNESGDAAKNVYAHGTPAQGYYWAGWAGSSTATTYSATSTAKSATKPGSTNSGESATMTTIYGFFKPVGISSATTPTSFSPTNATTGCTSYTGSVVFTTTNASNGDDFKAATITSKSGNGVYTITGQSFASNQVTVNYKFAGNGTYNTRNNSAKITLTSYGGENSLESGAITANFPAASVASGAFIVGGVEGDLYTTLTNPVNGNVEFAVLYADALGDFTLPTTVTSKSHAGDTWSIGTATGPNTNYETGAGKIVIPITFTSEGTVGNHTAQITLGSVTITLTAHVEGLADYDVKVIDANGTSELYKGDWADAAFTALNNNAGSTLQIGKDLTLGTVSARTISQNVTIDLNGKAITATLSAAGSLFNITSGKTLTITDSKSGGSISVSGNVNGRISVVEVTNGSLDVQKGDIVAINSNTGTTKANIYVAGVYLASKAWSGGRPTVTMSMSGGSVTGRRDGASGDYCYGVYCAGTGTNASAVDLNNGTITADFPNGRYAEGIYVAGKSTITNMTISGSSKSLAYAIRSEDGQLVVDRGTYTGTTTEGSARGILAVNANVLGGTFTAEAGTDHAAAIYTYGGTFVVNGGTFTATASTGKAYAIFVARNNDNIVKVNGGTFGAEGVTEAYGIGFDTSIIGNISTTSGSFTATASSTAATVKSYGLCLPANATADLAGATFTGITTGNATVTKSGDQSKPYGAYGILSEGTMTLTNCTLNGQAAKQFAYALYTTKSLTLTDSRLTATTSSDTYAQAFYINGSGIHVAANNITTLATSGALYAYGAYVQAGNLSAENSSFSAVTNQTGASSAANSYARGLYHASGTTLSLNGCTLSASGNASYSNNAYGLFSQGTATVDETTVTVSSVNSGYALYASASGASLTVNSGKFKATTASLGVSSPKKVLLNGGFYSHNTNLATYKAAGCGVFDVPSEMAEKGQGYNYKIGSVSNPGINVCKIGSTNYKTLEEALVKVGNNQTIVMTADYTLPAGDYILPAGATLLVPKNSSQTTANGTSTSNRTTSTATRAPYKTLTFAKGAHLVCNGTIETGADLYCGGQYSNQGSVYGPFGHIKMEEGSLIELENGANLWSWGYVTGAGIIDAKNGSKILEDFQIANWPGGTNASNMIGNNQNVMPIDQYFIQNIECDVIFRPGSSEVGATGVNLSIVGMKGTNDIRLVGKSDSKSLFLMDEKDTNPDTWVKKSYDKTTDYIIWTVNSGASIGKLTVSISGYAIESEEYTLPMANNMKIILNYGNVKLTQDLVFLPGSELVINKEAIGLAQGAKLYFYDHDDWVGKMYYSSYSPSWSSTTTNPRKNLADKDKDAKLFAKGMMKFSTSGSTKGGPYTTSHGADICSTNEDAGVIVFGSGALADDVLYYLPTSGNNTTGNVSVTTAKLHNGSGYATAYESTVGTTAGQLWGYLDNHWVKMTRSGCLYETVDGNKTYAYPSSFLEVEQNNPDDHAWHGVTETNRYVINTKAGMNSTDCVWWDAQPEEDGDYMVTNEGSGYTNAIFHYNSSNDYWEPYIFNITFNNGTTALGTSRVYKNVQPKFTGRFVAANGTVTTAATPSKSADTYYYYTWDGWVTNNANATADEPADKSWLVYANDNLPRAKANVTYYAHFKKTGKQYMITFNNYDGSQLQQGTQGAGKVAVYSGSTPVKPSTNAKVYTFSGWSPALATVSAAATYTAVFIDEDRPYTITFVNSNGDKLQERDVAYGSNPSYGGADPTRANSGFWSYDFIGWNDKDENFYAKGATLPAVAGAATYTAVYSSTDWTPEYTITFKDGDNKVLTTQYVRQGATPAYAGVTPTKSEDAGHTYTFNGNWSPAIAAATADKTYTAQFTTNTKQFTITFCREDGVELSNSDVNYGTVPTYSGSVPAKAETDEYTYTHDGWSDTKGGAKLASLPTVSGEATYYAHYSGTKRKYTILFKNGDATLTNTGHTDNLWEYGSTPTYNGSTPTKASDSQYSYTFSGWDYAMRTVTGNMTYTAQFNETPRQYKVTWDAATNGGTCATEFTDFSYNAAIGTLPVASKEDHTFNGWFTSATGGTQITTATKVTADVTYHAQFTINKYSFSIGVTPAGYGSVDVASILNIPHGTAVTQSGNTFTVNGTTVTATPTSADAQYTYKFDHWNNVPATATDNVTNIEAVFTRSTNTYTVTWKNGDVTLETDENVAYGATPHYDGATPTKTATAEFTYTFSGWSPVISSVLGDVIYTAQFGSTINQYTLTVATNNADWGTVDGGGTYDYNTPHTITATPKAGFKFVEWNDGNKNASREVTVTADVTYTATFDYDIANYTVKHWQQNIYDDDYTEVVADRQTNLSGTIGARTNAEAKTYTGFTAQPIEQPTIEVSGTVVNIYYNRKTYLIKWDVKLNGVQEAYKEETLRYGAMPSYGADPTKEQSEREVFTFSGWTPKPYAVDKDQIYEGSFNATARKYDVTWNNTDGTLIAKEENGYTWGAQPNFKGSTPTYSDETGQIYVFRGWKYKRTGAEYAKDDILPELAGNETYTAVYDIQSILDVPGEETISVNTTVDVTTVHVAGKLTVNSGTLTTTDLILEGSESASGEVIGKVTATNAYFDLSHEGGFKANTWYAVAVPWQVSVTAYAEDNGVYIKNGGSDPVRQELGRSFDLIYYDGSERANHGHSDACWKFVEDDASVEHIMKPGRAYMIYLTSDADVIRFERKADTDLQTTTLAVSTHSGNGNDKDANWNGIANPATYHAYINAHADTYHETENAGQIYDAENKQYNVVDLSSQNLVVGQPVFIQATTSSESVVAYASYDDAFHAAPRRARATTTPLTRCEILFAASGTEESDRIIVRADEDKEVNEYTVGQDLVKMGVSNLVPQMWIERYDAKLCINTLAPVNDAAVYPLGIFAPQTGEYTISINKQVESDFMLYLTIDGRSVWNLTYAPYTATLEQGTTNRYGLKLVRNSNAPAVTTGIQDAQADTAAQKIVLDGQVYILRGNNVYSVDGRIVK